MKRFHQLAAALLVAAAAAPLAAQAQDTQAPDSWPRQSFEEAPQRVWIAEIEATERGFRIGNPDADGQLIEFISYTCGHCASFVKEAGPTLELVAVAPGHLAIEVRPVIRNGLDLAITQLARCGGPERFKDLHDMFLYTQETWLPKAAGAPASQQAIWMRGDATGRLNAARALDFDDMATQRGLTMPQITACLSDDADAKAILAAGEADRTEFNVKGTPTFALNGETLEGVYSWPQLSQVLQERVSTTPPSADSE
ncbi:MAG: thioredoxin domain-containing protein [Erythrobacter sp.]|nr:thioredoxin domain-containing protein [Erythrobacter sp.]